MIQADGKNEELSAPSECQMQAKSQNRVAYYNLKMGKQKMERFLNLEDPTWRETNPANDVERNDAISQFGKSTDNDSVDERSINLDPVVASFRGISRLKVAVSENSDCLRYKLDLSSIKPHAKIQRLSIFVSSTFTDTLIERGILINKILPKLQAKGRKHGIVVILHDIRLGFRNRLVNGEDMWTPSRDEISRYNSLSSRSVFLSLLGNKYGSRVLPRSISQSEFELKLESWEDKSLRKYAREWYILDANSLPEPCYVLRSLMDSRMERDFFTDVLSRLLDSFSGMQIEGHSDMTVGLSTIEWETRYSFKMNSGNNWRYIWVERELDEPVDEAVDPICHFYDGCNDIENEPLVKLKSYIRSNIIETDIINIRCDSLADLGISIKTLPDGSVEHEYGYLPAYSGGKLYMDEWEEIVLNKLDEELDTLILDRTAWKSAKLNGFGISGADLDEVLFHFNYAKLKGNCFYGCERFIERCLAIIGFENCSLNAQTSNALISATSPIAPFSNLILGLFGPPGVGKASLMAHLSLICRSITNSQYSTVIIRFCGLTASSSEFLMLIRSICMEIIITYGLANSAGEFPKHNRSDAVKFAHNLLSKYPIVLFISMPELLKNENPDKDDEFDIISTFLINAPYNPKSRLIISYSSQLFSDSLDSVTIESKAPFHRMELPDSITNDCGIDNIRFIVENILREKHNRALTEEQLKFALNIIYAQPRFNMVYISLACCVMSTWRSFDRISSLSLPPDIGGIINQTYNNMRLKYGSELVKYSFLYLTYSLKGVNDVEMLDLLSLTDKVIAEVKSSAALLKCFISPLNRVPFHLWSRLCNDLKFLVVDVPDCSWRWRCSLVRDSVITLFNEEERLISHRIMGLYFGNLATALNKEVHNQPLLYTYTSHDGNHDQSSLENVWKTGTSINHRRCEESVYHLLESGLLKEASNELCSIDGIYTRSKANMLYIVVKQLKELLSRLGNTSKHSEDAIRVNHYLNWLEPNATTILRDPIRNIPATIYKQPLKSILRADMNQLALNKFKKLTLDSKNAQQSWIRMRSLGEPQGLSNSSTLIETNPSLLISDLSNNHIQFGKQSVITSCICISCDGSLAASAYDQKSGGIFPILVWDIQTSECKCTLLGHNDVVTCISVVSSVGKIVSGSDDGIINIWDICSGTLVNTLSGHSNGVLCLQVVDGNQDYIKERNLGSSGDIIVSASKDRNIVFWTMAGTCIKQERQDWDSSSIFISFDGSVIISGAIDFSLRVFDVKTSSFVKSLGGHSDIIYAVEMSRDGTLMVSGSFDKTVAVWDFKSGARINILRGQCSPIFSTISSTNGNISTVWCDKAVRQGATSIRLSPDSSSIVIGTDEGALEVWASRSGELIYRYINDESIGIVALAVSNDYTTLVAGTSDGKIKVWDSFEME